MSRRHYRALTLLVLSNLSTAGTTDAFRVDDMDLRDPHVHVSVPFVGCRDVTDTAFAGFSVNGQLQVQIQGDSDGDGNLDLSSVLLFQPLDLGQAGNPFDYGSATCSAPLATTACGQFQSGSALSGTAALQTTGVCLEPLPGTTFNYPIPVQPANAPCFLSPAGTVILDLGGGATVPLEGAQVGASFVNPPVVSQLHNGVLTGFITETAANATLLPASLPLIGGQPLASVLPGGTGNCAVHSDKDLRNGQPGWWFYLNFTAVPVPLTPTVPDPIFGHGFEDPPPAP